MLTAAEVARLWHRAVVDDHTTGSTVVSSFAAAVQRAALLKLVRGRRDAETLTVHEIRAIAKKGHDVSRG